MAKKTCQSERPEIFTTPTFGHSSAGYRRHRYLLVINVSGTTFLREYRAVLRSRACVYVRYMIVGGIVCFVVRYCMRSLKLGRVVVVLYKYTIIK